MVNKAAFFDRDGTLNVDVHYLYRPEDFIWIDGAVDAIKFCNAQGYKVIVVTNQSGVARGYYGEDDVRRLHAWMNRELSGHAAHIDAFYYCPHHPEGSVPPYTKRCDCRKPSPRLVNEACRAYDVDKEKSFMIGDKPLDVACAENAGIRGYQFPGGNLLTFVRQVVDGL